MQGYVYLKHKLSGGSILSATIPAVTEEKHFRNFLAVSPFKLTTVWSCPAPKTKLLP